MRQNLVETLIGAVVLVVATGFVAYGYAVSGEQSGGDTYELAAQFPRVNGLGIGSDVRLAGIKVGAVRSLALNPETYQARLVMVIREDVRLPDDSSIKVTSDGLLGDAYLSIAPGGSPDYLAAGDEIAFTQGAVDLIGLVGQALFQSGDD